MRMESSYLLAFKRLERWKADLVHLLRGWSSDDLARKPSPSAWSALEVLDHLLKTEIAVRQSCEENLKSRANVVTLAERAKSIALLFMMRTPIRIRVPDEASFVLPETPASLESLVARWDAERMELRKWLGTLTENARNIGVMRHPATGWLDINRALEFLFVHLRHHQFQIRRIAACIASTPIP